MILRFSLAVMVTTLTTACTTTVVNSIGDLPENRLKPVQASADSWNFLTFGFNGQFPDHAVAKLAEQCPGGPVKVSLVKDDYTFYLLNFLFRQRVTATGYCLKPSPAS